MDEAMGLAEARRIAQGVRHRPDGTSQAFDVLLTALDKANADAARNLSAAEETSDNLLERISVFDKLVYDLYKAMGLGCAMAGVDVGHTQEVMLERANTLNALYEAVVAFGKVVGEFPGEQGAWQERLEVIWDAEDKATKALRHPKQAEGGIA